MKPRMALCHRRRMAMEIWYDLGSANGYPAAGQSLRSGGRKEGAFLEERKVNRYVLGKDDSRRCT